MASTLSIRGNGKTLDGLNNETLLSLVSFTRPQLDNSPWQKMSRISVFPLFVAGSVLPLSSQNDSSTSEQSGQSQSSLVFLELIHIEMYSTTLSMREAQRPCQIS